ncbi:hypothetical protein Taro_053066 [Colocasia esculenta]|uniref:Uncharacterized protein n=1 Tax=Colocasia esculenta TaxID=4460 RepID=A0A843XLH0_COLES|nr:hypothetical protein [Colocasia esculenta]
MESRGMWKHHLWQLEDFLYLRILSVCRQHWVLLSTGASKQNIQGFWKAIAVDRRLGVVDRHRQIEDWWFWEPLPVDSDLFSSCLISFFFIHRDSLAISFEIPCYYAIHKLVAHPLCSSQIIGATGRQDGHLPFWNYDAKEEEEGGELTCIRHGPLCVTKAYTKDGTHEFREIDLFTAQKLMEEGLVNRGYEFPTSIFWNNESGKYVVDETMKWRERISIQWHTIRGVVRLGSNEGIVLLWGRGDEVHVARLRDLCEGCMSDFESEIRGDEQLWQTVLPVLCATFGGGPGVLSGLRRPRRATRSQLLGSRGH